MARQFRRINFYQIRFYVLDDAIAHVGWQLVDDRAVD
jgi:hypothetical protein